MAAPSIWTVCVAFLVFLPVAGLTWTSLRLEDGGIGLDNYVDVLTRPDILEAIRNSFLIATGTTVGALMISLPFAFLVSRTDMPGRQFFRSVAVLTFAAPGFIAAMGWILLLGPRGGLLNQYVITPLGLPAFNIFSPQGVVLVLVLFLYPLLFLPVADALDNMDNRLEEAAESQGASRWTVLRRITFPLIIPPIFSGSLLVFISAFVIFGPVALLGGPVGFKTIPTAMYQLMTFPPRIEYAAVLGTPVLLVLAGLLILQRRVFGKRKFVTVGGKPGQRRTLALGIWRLPAFLFGAALLLLSIVLPFGVLLLTSFRKAIGLPLSTDNFVLLDNYRALVEHPEILRSFVNSLVIALLATVAAIAIALLGAWLAQRSTLRARGSISPIMLAPLAFPGAILGIAMVITFAGSPFWMGGTLTIMGIAYLIRVLPQCFTYVDAGLRQVSVETEEASRNLGASWLETMRRVTIPLLRGPILSVGILSFVLLFRELDISIFLYSGSNTVAPVVLYQLASESQFQLMGALAVVMLAVNLGVVVLAKKLLGVKVAA
jgi:iron(III) transport system permease protein